MPDERCSPIVQDHAHRMMKEVMVLKDQRWVDGSKVMSIVDQLNIRGDEARIYFLRELLSIVRRLPLKIYSDDESRMRLITAVQEALDTAVDEEEE